MANHTYYLLPITCYLLPVIGITKKDHSALEWPLSFSGLKGFLLSCYVCTLLGNTSLLTRKSAEIIQFSATNFTNLVHLDALDVR